MSRQAGSPLIIFDFDGVIADSVAMYADAYRQTFPQFDREIPFTDLQGFRLWYDSTWENNWGDLGKEPLEKAIEKFATYILYDAVTPFSGIDEVLSTLSSKATLAIASTTPSIVIKRFLKKHSLDSWIREVYSPLSGSEKINIFRSAIEEHAEDPSNVAVVGDTPSDIRPAKALGCFAVASLYGWYDEKRLLEEGPDAVARRPEEIITALGSRIDRGPSRCSG